MGLHTTTDVAKFVAHGVHLRHHNEDEPFVWWLEATDVDVNECEILPKPDNGWTLDRLPDGTPYNQWWHIGKKGRIGAACRWVKGEHKVYVLNESHYESVGEGYYALVADTREALEAFMADAELEGDIEEDDSIAQTL
jgi:hypothetical protein